MKKVVAMVALTAAVLVAGYSSALAADGMFGPFKFGPEGTLFFGGDDEDHGDSSAFGIGVRGEYDMNDLVGLPIAVAASFDYIFVDCGVVDCTAFETNLNALYTLPVPVPEMFGIYAGGGMNFSYVKGEYHGVSDSETDINLNLLAGSKFNLDMILTPFVEVKFEVGGAPWFGVTAGVLF